MNQPSKQDNILSTEQAPGPNPFSPISVAGEEFVSSREPMPAKTGYGECWWFAFRGSEALVRDDGATTEIPRLVDVAELGLPVARRQYLGSLGALGCWSVELAPEATAPTGMAFRNLRSLHGHLTDQLFAIAGRAAQIVEWDRTHQYCGRCRARMDYAPGERAKVCPECSLMSFPRLSPAIIVLIERDGRVLLARGTNFPEAFYSVLAGFVEPGESLEETVVREVREEVGIEIGNLRYFGSQPWPFPHSLMIGFTATYVGGELKIDDEEIAEAGWFTPDNLPRIPERVSIARRLIDDFVARHRPPNVANST